jgi:hypothetical protein
LEVDVRGGTEERVHLILPDLLPNSAPALSQA